MTSILGTQSIQHPNGTAAASINSSGVVTFSQPAVGTFIRVVDQFRLTADITGTNATITSNLERVDHTGAGFITAGGQMSENSGIFTFPETGIYEIYVVASLAPQDDNSVNVGTEVTLNNSSFTNIANAQDGNRLASSTTGASGSSQCFVDVTDTSNVKVRFVTSSMASNSIVSGNTSANNTSFSFIRLGDT
tara:strand:- start:538 stop:1113 length:576 start_codon:yes stop_codon:yes gene_type:complete